MSAVCTCFGNGGGTSASREIDKELQEERKKLRRQVKVLLLGSGESGKSTFVKQMVIIHGRGEFTRDEATEYRRLIYMNALEGMLDLLSIRRRLGIEWVDSSHQPLADKMRRLDRTQLRAVDMRLFIELAPLVRELWQDKAVQESYDRRSDFQVHDSCKYYFENIDRIAQLEYYPTNLDILHCRKATRTIADHYFTIQKVPFRFIDVGGQRSQRQKWFQLFEGVTSILFLAASNEYDQKLREDRKRNRVMESVEVFDTIVNNTGFAKASMILFLNKTDLLRAKVAQGSNIQEYFEDFSGDPANLHDVQTFIRSLFENVRREKNRPLFYHYTTAVDTENIRHVFKDVKDTILEQHLRTLMMH